MSVLYETLNDKYKILIFIKALYSGGVEPINHTRVEPVIKVIIMVRLLIFHNAAIGKLQVFPKL